MTSWILTPPDRLADADRVTPDRITGRCQEPGAATALVREFTDMLCHRQGSDLGAWTAAAEASCARDLRSFSAGLRKDWAAVTAGLTLPWSSGAVEGHVNRIKMIKDRCTGGQAPTSCARPASRFLLQVPGLIGYQHGTRIARVLDKVAAHVVADTVGIPLRARQPRPSAHRIRLARNQGLRFGRRIPETIKSHHKS